MVGIARDIAFIPADEIESIRSKWVDFKKAERSFEKGNQLRRLNVNQLKQLCEIYSLGNDDLYAGKKDAIIESLEMLV